MSTAIRCGACVGIFAVICIFLKADQIHLAVFGYRTANATELHLVSGGAIVPGSCQMVGTNNCPPTVINNTCLPKNVAQCAVGGCNQCKTTGAKYKSCMNTAYVECDDDGSQVCGTSEGRGCSPAMRGNPIDGYSFVCECPNNGWVPTGAKCGSKECK